MSGEERAIRVEIADPLTCSACGRTIAPEEWSHVEGVGGVFRATCDRCAAPRGLAGRDEAGWSPTKHTMPNDPRDGQPWTEARLDSWMRGEAVPPTS